MYILYTSRYLDNIKLKWRITWETIKKKLFKRVDRKTHINSKKNNLNIVCIEQRKSFRFATLFSYYFLSLVLIKFYWCQAFVVCVVRLATTTKQRGEEPCLFYRCLFGRRMRSVIWWSHAESLLLKSVVTKQRTAEIIVALLDVSLIIIRPNIKSTNRI